MRTILTVGLALAFASGVMFAQATDQKGAGKGMMEKFSGTVESVDAPAMKLTVKNAKGMTREFALESGTKVVKSGKVIGLSEVSEGDHVAVSYTGPTVKKVTVHSMKKDSAGESK